jgi:hypothetical protein
MKKAPTGSIATGRSSATFSAFGRDVLRCTALVDAAYSEYRAVVDGPHTPWDRIDAWDTAIEKRDAAYARFANVQSE